MEDVYAKYQFVAEETEEMPAWLMPFNDLSRTCFDTWHIHNDNIVMLFTHGCGRHDINFKEWNIMSRSVHLLTAGDIHRIVSRKQLQGFSIRYKKAFLTKLKMLNPDANYFRFFAHTRIISLQPEQNEVFDFTIHEINTHAHEERYLLSLIANLFTKLALDFDKEENKVGQTEDDALVRQLINLIDIHFKEHFTEGTYAEEMNCSLSALKRKVKKATGKTIDEWQQERLLIEAQRLLRKPDSRCKEVAYQLNFSSESYFNNWFKKLTGQPPGRFKT